ncbi:MAG TPA: rhodanese-like domain-containing protein [Solirubrobacteraceae bacterium]|jgi:hydroxyacylglutathione hydrolase/adenylyltransferase/sulfurtransferase|nr:rhodanese-like domain-containing protein [Solirubrobacteraceae bacterium]
MNVFAESELEVSVERVAEWLEQDTDLQLIDVRETYEHEAGHIAQARHIELERLASQAETIDRERRVVFQCRVGARSAMAAQAFRAAGFEAYSMEGGLSAWAEKGLPLSPADGYVADH